MEYKFLSKDDKLLFVRADAIGANIAEHEATLTMAFPLDKDRKIERGMRLVFTDADGDGAEWIRYFEVRKTRTSCIARVQEVEAEDLLLAELSDSMMDVFSVSHGDWNTVVGDILITSLWQMGNTIPTLPAATVEYDVYTISRPNESYLDLRASPSSTAKSLGKYNNGTEVQKVSTYNSSWMKVKIGGKTGYMFTSYLTFARTVTVSGLPTITMDKTYTARYAMMMEVLEKVGLRPIPRIVRSGATLTRYVDFDLTQKNAFRGARIEIDRNAYADQIEEEDRGLYTRVYPIGKDGLTIDDVFWWTTAGDPGNSPSGYGWVEDPAAASLYGRSGAAPRTTMVEFTDIEYPVELINAGWAWLQTVNFPRLSIELSAHDMWALGYDGKRLVMGERVNTILQPIGTMVQLNVVMLTRDLEKPENTQITIGAFSEDAVSQAVSTANELTTLKDDVKQVKKTMLDKVYPVGAIYLSTTNTNPGTLFGGTWSQIKDRFLLADGDTYTNGATGGASTHKHLGTTGYNSGQQGYVATNGSTDTTADTFHVSNQDASGSNQGGVTVPYTGNGSSMPPYLVVYMWKRTA